MVVRMVGDLYMYVCSSCVCTGPVIQSNQIRFDAGKRRRFIILPRAVSGGGKVRMMGGEGEGRRGEERREERR
jgi:hypothetical protein